MWDPKFAKKISLVSTKTTPSVFVVIACAAVATGKPLRRRSTWPTRPGRSWKR